MTAVIKTPTGAILEKLQVRSISGFKWEKYTKHSKNGNGTVKCQS
jgi:hypothetical protein